VAETFDGFDWDAANVEHTLRHQVTPFEVEEAVSLPHLTFPAPAVTGEKRWKLLGRTAAGRFLVVVFTIRRRLFRTVTAYPMNAAQRRRYAPQIEKASHLPL
jgi:uncharacterized protein